jgi:hypothetical protein
MRYLDARPSALWAADVRHAHPRLVTVGCVSVTVGFALVGAAGAFGVVSLLLRPGKASGAGSMLAALGTGGMLCGAIAFAVLGALGHVVLAELVGERSAESSRPSSRAAAIARVLVEAVGGALWGAVWGLFIGIISGVIEVFVLPNAELIVAGMLGGMIVGLTAALLRMVLARSRGPGGLACEWAWLGPLPTWAYGLPFSWARRRYLR